jgi:hypothetical protein
MKIKDNIKFCIKGTITANKISNSKIKDGNFVRILKLVINSKLRAAQLSKIRKEAKKYKFQWTKQIYKVVNIIYRENIKQIQVKNRNENLRINEFKSLILKAV